MNSPSKVALQLISRHRSKRQPPPPGRDCGQGRIVVFLLESSACRRGGQPSEGSDLLTNTTCKRDPDRAHNPFTSSTSEINRWRPPWRYFRHMCRNPSLRSLSSRSRRSRECTEAATWRCSLINRLSIGTGSVLQIMYFRARSWKTSRRDAPRARRNSTTPFAAFDTELPNTVFLTQSGVRELTYGLRSKHVKRNT